MRPVCDGRLEDPLHVCRFASDLVVREAKGCEASGGMCLVAEVIACLLGRRAVVAQPVRLDDEP